ncbi:hypothetical protein POSPLADRAFT_1166015 [Postia placenta MAD-698-R-SB12]|uniref:Peptidase A1 domain-containing protein n=1 Tax=Postia placenta MAD-698-R-SB12 TaxID=670580 RepID=A0A1X6NBM6_9APHY|nr:hypothetical protein POSPLADRAFT_1166015 [Postia placenta MAD-698-R-SB12]OSX66049.1 hypothetical protein POSPLADRAFT_1166015 [Postia placenta MAD-698-R-SB12]
MLLTAVTTFGLLALSASSSIDSESSDDGSTKIILAARKGPKGYASSLRRRKMSEINVPLGDYYLGTDLQWFGNISVGTPPQTVAVIYDTGSYTLEIDGVQCGAPCGSQPKFDPSLSATFVDLNENSTLVFETGIGVDPLESDTDFVMYLTSARDTVTIGDIVTQNVSLYTIYNQTAAFTPDPFSGIQGMGPSIDGFWAGVVNKGLPALFGMYLTPKAVGHAELTIAGIDQSKFQGKSHLLVIETNTDVHIGELTYANIPSGIDFLWELASPVLYVNGETRSILRQNRTIYFDSGTPNVYFDTNTTEAIYAMISPEIQPYAPEPGAYGIACSKIDQLPAEISVTFTSITGEPFNLTVPSSEFNVGPFEDEPTICQTMINALDVLDLLGGSLLKHYYSVWDIDNQRLGFAPNVY